MSESLRRAAGLLLLTAACGIVPVEAVRADATGDYNVALEFYKQERWPQSSQAFRDFLKNHSGDSRAPSARLYLGESLTHERQFKEAREAFREFVRAPGGGDQAERPLGLFRVAECSYFLGDNAAARDELTAFLKDHGQHELAPRALVYLGQTQFRLNDARSAATTFDAALQRELDPRLTEEAKYGLAGAVESLGDKPRAVAIYRELAANTAGRRADDAQFNLGARAFDDSDFQVAAQEFAAVGERFPRSPLVPLAELNAGYADYHLQRYPAAIAHFERAAQDAQHADTAAFWIGLSQKSLGDYLRAADTLERQYSKNQDQPLAEKLLFHWADSELRREDYAKAADLFQQVARRWPQGELADDSLHSATEAALRAGDLDLAERLNQEFQQQHAASGLRLLQQLLAGRIRLSRGDTAAQTDPNSKAAADQYRGAVAEFTRVLAGSTLPRTQALARVQLARAYTRLDDGQRALETLQPLVAEFEAGRGEAEFLDVLPVQAETLLSLNRAPEAAKLAEIYLDRRPDGPEAASALATLAVAQARQSNRGAVAVTLDRLDKLDVTRVHAARTAYEAGEVAYAAKQWDWAVELYRRAVAHGDTTGYHAAALSALGYSQYEGGQFKDAAASFADLMAAHPEDRRLASNAAHMRGLALQQSGDKAEAARAYQAGLTQFSLAAGNPRPSDADLESGLNAYRCAKGAARVLREIGQVDESDRSYEAAYQELKKQPADRQAELDKLINEWALLSYEAEKFDRSDEVFGMLLRERPGSDLADDARLYLGESHFFSERLDEARKLFQQLGTDPKADEFVRHRSLVLLLDITARQKDWREVARAADALTKQFPTSNERWYAQYRIGEAALEQGDVGRAIAALSAVREHADDPAVARAEWLPSAYLLLAEARLKQKDYPGVEATLGELRTRDPQSPWLYQADEILGRSFKNRAMFPEARAAFANVIDSEAGRRTETAAKAQFHIAETHLIEKNLDAALTEYYKVYVNYQYPAWQAPALFQAAQCDEELKNWQGATKTYERLLAEFAGSEFAAKARPRLEAARKKVAP
jgi:TolA-binding protein